MSTDNLSVTGLTLITILVLITGCAGGPSEAQRAVTGVHSGSAGDAPSSHNAAIVALSFSPTPDEQAPPVGLEDEEGRLDHLTLTKTARDIKRLEMRVAQARRAGRFEQARALQRLLYSLVSQQESRTEEGPPQAATIDLLVLYTGGADQVYDAGAETRINHMVNVSNQIYGDSGVHIELRIAHMAKVDYEDDDTSSLALDKVTYGDHPAFADTAALRAEHRADMVVLFRPYANDGSCGVAWVGGYGTGGDFSDPIERDYAYAHVSINCATYVLAHELGHIMGLNHSRVENSVGGTFDYALGHGEQGDFVTIMASKSAFSAAKVKVFSNPELECNGKPCGIARDDTAFGADAAYTLNHVRHQVASYY